jgi:hypothetical protein
VKRPHPYARGRLIAFKVDRDWTQKSWCNAIMEVDETLDPTHLLPLLKECAPPKVYPYLEDLLRRHRFSRRGGRPRLPNYVLKSKQEFQIIVAVELIRDSISEGMDQEAAIEDASKRFRIPHTTLENALLGKRGSAHRANGSQNRRRRD